MTAHDDYVARGYCPTVEPDSGEWCRLYTDHEEPHSAITSSNGDAEHGQFTHQHVIRWPIGADAEVVAYGVAPT